jgi:hypothetical protein
MFMPGVKMIESRAGRRILPLPATASTAPAALAQENCGQIIFGLKHVFEQS